MIWFPLSSAEKGICEISRMSPEVFPEMFPEMTWIFPRKFMIIMKLRIAAIGVTITKVRAVAATKVVMTWGVQMLLLRI